jgi:hypothetical protein
MPPSLQHLAMLRILALHPRGLPLSKLFQEYKALPIVKKSSRRAFEYTITALEQAAYLAGERISDGFVHYKHVKITDAGRSALDQTVALVGERPPATSRKTPAPKPRDGTISMEGHEYTQNFIAELVDDDFISSRVQQDQTVQDDLLKKLITYAMKLRQIES